MDPTKGSLPMAGPPMPNVAALTGPILIGALLDYFFFGVLSLQLYIHYYSFPDERLSIKLLVYFVYSLELIQICCTAADIYFWFGTGFGNVVRLNVTYLSPFDTPMIGAIVALIVQLFFCYRIWKLSRSQWHLYTAIFIGAISFLQAAGGIGGGISGHVNKYFSVATETNRIYAYIWLLGEAVADVLIAVTMTHLLLCSRTEMRSNSRNMVTRVVRLTVQSNSITAGVAVIAFVLFAIRPRTNDFTAPTIFLSKLYSNTFLATFNYRIVLRRKDAYDNSSAGYSLSGDSGTRFTSFLATTTELGA